MTAKAKELHRRLKLDLARVEKKKTKTRLGTRGYLYLCTQECELMLKCINAIYWSSYCGEV